MKLKKILAAAVPAALAVLSGSAQEKVVVGYVTGWSDAIPDPQEVTHLNYAFGHVSSSFDSVEIDRPENLRRLTALKQNAPDLKVLLSIGGWTSGNFSEMASDAVSRKSFARACRSIADDFGLDGIDIDWEYPGNGSAGISWSKRDPENFVLLMRDLREALGSDRLLTLASGSELQGLNFRDFLPYVDFVNVMTYDMNRVPLHHSPLHRSQALLGDKGRSVDESVKMHLDAGVPKEKLVVGLPLYGRGRDPYTDFVDYRFLELKPGCEERWDDQACAPYIIGPDGTLVLGFDNPRSIGLKCDYILDNGLRGAMYWDYSLDGPEGPLRKIIARKFDLIK